MSAITARLGQGHHREVLEELQALAANSPHDGDVYRVRAGAWLGQGNYRAAVEDLVKANHLLLGGVPLRDCARLVLRDIGKGMDPALIASHLHEHPHGRADFCTLLALGNSLRAAGDPAGARAAYEQACELRPGDDAALLRLACLLAAMGDGDAADRAFSQFAGRLSGPESVVRLSRDALVDIFAVNAASLEYEWHGSDWRDDDGAQVAAVVSCDAGYFERFATIVARSFAAQSGLQARLHFHLVNPTQESLAQFESLSAEGLPLQLSASTEQREFASLSHAKTYYACARFLLAADLLACSSTPLLILDADMVVLGDLGVLLESVRDSDVAAFELDPAQHDLWDTYQASALWVAPTEGGRTFLQRTAAYIDHFRRAGRLQWYLDQVAVFAALSDSRFATPARDTGPGAPPPLRLARLDPRLIQLSVTGESELSSDAVLWSLLMSLPSNQKLLDSPMVQRFV